MLTHIVAAFLASLAALWTPTDAAGGTQVHDTARPMAPPDDDSPLRYWDGIPLERGPVGPVLRQ